MASSLQPDLFDSGAPPVVRPGNRALGTLLVYLNANLSKCDDTFRLTKQWARDRGFDSTVVIQLVRLDGATCDCEVEEYAGLFGSWSSDKASGGTERSNTRTGEAA